MVNSVIEYIKNELVEARTAKDWGRVERLEEWLNAEFMVQAVKDRKSGKAVQAP